MKAVSPLVAAVLLIAVTMTIAGVLAYWTTSFVKEKTEYWEKNTTIGGECNFADFRVYHCSYNTSVGRINLFLNNIRQVELKQMRVYVIYNDGSLSPEILLNTTLIGGAIQPYYITGITQNFTKIIIKTHCPEISVEDDCR